MKIFLRFFRIACFPLGGLMLLILLITLQNFPSKEILECSRTESEQVNCKKFSSNKTYLLKDIKRVYKKYDGTTSIDAEGYMEKERYKVVFVTNDNEKVDDFYSDGNHVSLINNFINSSEKILRFESYKELISGIGTVIMAIPMSYYFFRIGLYGLDDKG